MFGEEYKGSSYVITLILLPPACKVRIFSPAVYDFETPKYVRLCSVSICVMQITCDY
jgi:hypothetical protein